MLLVCFLLVFGEDLAGGLGPGEWVAVLVPAVDEGADLGVEVFDGGEDSSADGRTVDDQGVGKVGFRGLVGSVG